MAASLGAYAVTKQSSLHWLLSSGLSLAQAYFVFRVTPTSRFSQSRSRIGRGHVAYYLQEVEAWLPGLRQLLKSLKAPSFPRCSASLHHYSGVTSSTRFFSALLPFHAPALHL